MSITSTYSYAGIISLDFDGLGTFTEAELRQAIAAARRERMTPQQQLTNALSALADLISDWNDLAEDGDRGRDNAALCLTLWDDGSGRIGTFYDYKDDTGTFCDLSMNIQAGWNDMSGLVSFLMEWVSESDVFQEGNGQ